MIHFRKRLNIIDIFKALFFFKKINLSQWKKKSEQKSLFTSKSSWSILLIGIWVKKIKKKNPVFLVPDYYCNYSLNLLRILGAQIHFYPINKNFEADLNLIDLSIKPDVLIATHYFGKEQDFSIFNIFCDANNIWLVEDATHCLKQNGKISNHGHFVIFSQHKFFPNINGALLLLNEKKLSEFDVASFGHKTTWLNSLETFVLEKNIHTYNNNLRTIFNIIYDNMIKIFMKEKIKNFTDDDINQKKYPNPNIDFISYKILTYFSYKTGLISDYRNRCHLIMEHSLNCLFNKEDYEILSNTDFDPYLLIIKSNNKIKEIYNSLKNLGFAIQTWPDLPTDIKLKSDAYYLRNHLAFIPLNKISKGIINSDKFEDDFCSINFNECLDKKEWEYLTKDFPFNILQTWEFGNFKSSLFFVKAKRILISDKNNELIGCFQAIYYNFFGISFILINRGPIFKNNSDENLKKIICQKIAFNLKKNILTHLFFKPELEFNKDNIIFQHKNKASYFKFPFWSSSKVDLKNDEIKIFEKFKNTLRSEIKKGKKNLKINLYDKKNNINWIIKNYFSVSNKKKFKTINENLIHFLDPNKIISISAEKDDNICSGILIYCHGNVATYLMSYNTEIGRKNYGNQVLLWEMIKYLKKENFSHLDLGGIDSYFNLSVAKFKLAFGGKLYKLVGSNLI